MFILIASDSPGVATKVRKALALHGQECPITHLVGCEQLPALLQATAKSVEMLFLILPPDESRALGIVRRTRALTAAQLVAVGSARNSKSILEALHAGADDYLDEESDLGEQVRASLERIELRADVTPSGRLIAVTAASGGCGASTTAANLAVKLAQQTGACGLLELISGFGDLSALFNMAPRYTLGDLLRNQETIDRAMLEQSVVTHVSGVRLLAAPSPFDDVELTDGPAIGRIISLSRGMYPWTVLDIDTRCHRNTDLLKSVNPIIVATRLDFTALCNTRRLLDGWSQLHVEMDRVLLVGTRVGQCGEVPLEQAQTLLGGEFIARIPDDVVTANVSENCGNPAVLEMPKSTLSRAMTQLSDRLSQATAPCDSKRQTGAQSQESWHQHAVKKVAGILFC